MWRAVLKRREVRGMASILGALIGEIQALTGLSRSVALSQEDAITCSIATHSLTEMSQAEWEVALTSALIVIGT